MTNTLRLTLASIMKNPVITVSEDSTLEDVVEKLAIYDVGCVIVTDGNLVKGIISERDIIKALKEHRAKVLEELVVKFMMKEVISLPPESTVVEALHVMFSKKIRHLVISKDGELKGIVSLRDVANAIFRSFMIIFSYIMR